jgi:hypothetical protein
MINEEETESPLRSELKSLLNRHSAESPSNTPDHILADYLVHCLDAFNYAVRHRADWYGRIDVPGRGSVPFPEPAVVELAP